MTAPQLLALITAAILLQLAVGITVALTRRRATPPALALPAPAPEPRGERAWEGWRGFRVTRRTFEDAAHTQCSFTLQPVDGLPLPAFRPGQFLTFSLTLPGESSDGPNATRTITRCYSLSDRPDPTHYRVTIKRTPPPSDHPEAPPGLSSNHFHDHVQVGDVLQVKAPSGQFFIDPDPAVPVVLIGGGIGITPMMSMARWCAVHQPQRVVHLFYGVRHRAELAFREAINELAASHPALRLHIVLSRPAPADVLGVDYQHQGHVDLALLRDTLPHGRHQFYVCGPPALMQTLVPALAAWGVPTSDIHYEAFGPASVKWPGATGASGAVGSAAPATRAAPAPIGVAVTFQRSGRTLPWTGQDASLLDFAERHGIAVESGCRAGGCGSCETRVVKGSVQYAQAPDHDPTEGHCLLCVGRPASALVLEA